MLLGERDDGLRWGRLSSRDQSGLSDRVGKFMADSSKTHPLSFCR